VDRREDLDPAQADAAGERTLTGVEWQRVKDLFDSALRLPGEERTSFLTQQPDGPTVLAEVRSLLATYDQSPQFMEATTFRFTPDDSPPAMPNLAGRRIGAWELVREIGRGGMGIVWEARRADEHYQQQAAIKLLPVSFLSAHAVAHFCSERQILASLDHPNIARLLDGGTLEDGSPYLVMEYIEGHTLDVWCNGEGPNLRAKLRLFLSVCAAVEYAHRHMVVHRDLKPANILVTPEGVPKLLDFGIAKLIEPDGVPVRATTRLLTPEFASPEQLQGGIVTALSDVFSLGVLLYILLTGRKPFIAAEGDTLGVMRAVCEDEPVLPSLAAKEDGRWLGNELDAIALQALRKDPEERYHSVGALADDVLAWLEARDVAAAPQPWWRRSVKLVRRHKTQSAAVAVAAISLIAGSGISIWQATVAHRQRQRAERRFRDVRKFSRSVLFELHQAIRDLPGATPARNLLLQRATEFLDDLASDPSADAGLKLELAEGYNNLGHVQGEGFTGNLGHRDQAIESFRKAVRLGEGAWAAAPSPDAGMVLLDIYSDLSRAFLNKNNRAEAEVWHNKQRDLAASMEARYPRDLRVREAVADSYNERALYRVQLNDLPRAKELYRQALSLYAELGRKGVTSKEYQSQYAVACKRLGAILILENSLEEAEARYRTALGIEDALCAAAPENSDLRIGRTFTLSDLALILKRKENLHAAAGLYEQVLQTRREAMEKDPKNARLIRLTASTAERLAKTYSSMARHHEAIRLGWEAVRLQDLDASGTQDYSEKRDAAQKRVTVAFMIVIAAKDRRFHAGQGERISDAQTALQEAAPAVPNPKPGQVLSPADRQLEAEFRELHTRLASLIK
jgi:non-specific serine/threonine protein kinase/serine/threonine-protein kinase